MTFIEIDDSEFQVSFSPALLRDVICISVEERWLSFFYKSAAFRVDIIGKVTDNKSVSEKLANLISEQCDCIALGNMIFPTITLDWISDVEILSVIDGDDDDIFDDEDETRTYVETFYVVIQLWNPKNKEMYTKLEDRDRVDQYKNCDEAKVALGRFKAKIGENIHKSVKFLKRTNETFEKRLAALEKMVEEIYHAPGMPGCLRSKRRFQDRIDSFEKRQKCT